MLYLFMFLLAILILGQMICVSKVLQLAYVSIRQKACCHKQMVCIETEPSRVQGDMQWCLRWQCVNCGMVVFDPKLIPIRSK